MTIPDGIRKSYQAGREDPLDQMCDHLCHAIVWAVAGWLEEEFKTGHATSVSGDQCFICGLRGEIDPRHHWARADWLTEADRLLRKPVK